MVFPQGYSIELSFLHAFPSYVRTICTPHYFPVSDWKHHQRPKTKRTIMMARGQRHPESAIALLLYLRVLAMTVTTSSFTLFYLILLFATMKLSSTFLIVVALSVASGFVLPLHAPSFSLSSNKTTVLWSIRDDPWRCFEFSFLRFQEKRHCPPLVILHVTSEIEAVLKKIYGKLVRLWSVSITVYSF